MFDLEMLTQPISDTDPCGPDLDADGDIHYLNFFAGAEQVLPTSYFDVATSTGGRGRFDPKAVDFDSQFAAIAPLIARTRDLRLTVLLAKLCILNRDLAGFATSLEAVSFLLEHQWDSVHPRGEDGDYGYRAVSVEAIDVLPTVVNPLQFLPLIENRRHGALTFRAYQAAKGQVTSSNDTVIDLGDIDRIIGETDLDHLKATSAAFVNLASLLTRMQKTWRDRAEGGPSLSFEKLSGTIGDISIWLKDIVSTRDPTAIGPVADEDDQTEITMVSGGAQQTGSLALASSRQAAGALTAIARYFAVAEPSSPALLLVRQAREMVGKSFVEVVRMLIPDQADAAAVNIGRGEVFGLPIERMAALSDDEMSADVEIDAPVPDRIFAIDSRGQALALLGQVETYFKTMEPSSPVPFLVARAREMAQRDFLSILQEVLPEGALKTIERQV
jgi:type VI secretion system protein ImpA